MNKFKVNDRVRVNIYKGGYWVDMKPGTVTKVTEKRVKVKTSLNEKFYSPKSIEHA